MQPKRKSGRVTLTKAELNSDEGQGLVDLINKIGEDSTITIDEVSELLSAVSDPGPYSSMAGSSYLREVIHQIIEDGKIDRFEQERLRLAMARVLPKQIREEFEISFPADIKANAGHRPPWHNDPATERQLSFMLSLEIAFHPSITKGEASELISETLDKQNASASERQVMVLRFWDRLDLASHTKQEICDWMDAWYAEDPMRKSAWEEWKAQAIDDRDVPIGSGPIWLERVRARATGGSGQKIASIAPTAPRKESIPLRLPPFIAPKQPQRPGLFSRLVSLFLGR